MFLEGEIPSQKVAVGSRSKKKCSVSNISEAPEAVLLETVPESLFLDKNACWTG